MCDSKTIRIVQLDGLVHVPSPSVPHEIARYRSTQPDQIIERIKDADVVVCTLTHLSYEILKNHGPNLKMVASMGVGVNHIDMKAAAERGITVMNVPAQNTDAVTEHAFGLYYAVKRRILTSHQFTLDGALWAAKGAISVFDHPPRINKEETLGIIGYGAIGKSVERMGKALDMKVLIAERKGASTARDGRTSFEDVVKDCTVLIMICPLDASTRDLISETELRTMRNDAIIVNVGRGGIINEAALKNALLEHRLAGAATDVFEIEPATKETSLLLDPNIPNLVLTPHTAWYSSATLTGTLRVSKENLEDFAAGKPINVVRP